MNEDFPFDLNSFVISVIITTIVFALSYISLVIAILTGGIILLFFMIIDLLGAQNDKL